MEQRTRAFTELAKVFSNHGYKLYLVGGTVRDVLLNIPLTDMDAVTDATPEEMKHFIDGDFTYAIMGSVKCKYDGIRFDVTTLRKEKNYVDSRHPTKVKFIKDLKGDSIRRDFTINAMYMDEHFKLYDYVDGSSDLNNHIIRMVGNPKKRLKEDPLRILRCIRFSLTYGFVIEKSLEKALIKSGKYLKNISKEKIKMELHKTDQSLIEKQNELFKKYSLNTYLEI